MKPHSVDLKHCLHSIYIDFPANAIDYQMFLPCVRSGPVTAGSNLFLAFAGNPENPFRSQADDLY